ncbi:MAG: GTPase Era [Bacteroidia bacterium]|nr:GTPase Era [Bacteroidia bacterium]
MPLSDTNNNFRSGFVNLLGNPNAGKSTLMNALIGEKLSIITYKAQTTRHRIMGIMSGKDFQVVYSDTPGFVDPAYKLHESMNETIREAINDADIFVLVVDVKDDRIVPDAVLERISAANVPLIIALNKSDLIRTEQLLTLASQWQKKFPQAEVVPVSALKSRNVEKVFDLVMKYLPVHPPYYDTDTLTTRTTRFFVAEMIREKIFLYTEKEIPYASEVVIDSYKEEGRLDRIHATIFVERDTQRSILIGKNGSMLKKIGTEARLDMEEFLGKKVFLELFVKVDKDWRNQPGKLKRYGY